MYRDVSLLDRTGGTVIQYSGNMTGQVAQSRAETCYLIHVMLHECYMY